MLRPYVKLIRNEVEGLKCICSAHKVNIADGRRLILHFKGIFLFLHDYYLENHPNGQTQDISDSYLDGSYEQ